MTSPLVSIVKVDRFGQNARVIVGATVTQQPTWEHNSFGRFGFSLPFDSRPSWLGKYDEIAVVFGSTVLWWGLVVDVDSSDDGQSPPRCEFRCADLLWYFRDRYVGKASRTNYALDPNFEADPGDPLYGAWAVNGSVTFTRDGARYKLHGRSAKVEAASAGEDWFIYEDILG